MVWWRLTRGTWGPNSTVQEWAEGAPAWTRCGAVRSRREGPAGPSWGFDFPINRYKRGLCVPSLRRRADGTHTRRPPGACGAAPPTQLQRAQACSCFAGGPRALPPISPTLAVRRTLLGRPHPMYPKSLRSGTLLGRPHPASPSSPAPGPFSGDPAPPAPWSWAPRPFSGDPTPPAPGPGLRDPSRETPPHVPPGLGLRIPLAPSPVLPGSRPAVASRQPGTNPSYKSLGGFRSPESLRRVDQPQEPAGRKLSQLTMMPSPGTPASRMPASPPGELV